MNKQQLENKIRASANKICSYPLSLCKLVMGQLVTLWNNAWLKSEYANNLPINNIVNKETLSKNNSVIIFCEMGTYYEI